ncbi:hypothetical protein UPYG_G00222530 [Umbra pygmaea]|uniref:Uncharacterized protein n=1 Tax=Umbra pygmaea TaxID=75934 RepID=A0ABD0WBT5_UMBPY
MGSVDSRPKLSQVAPCPIRPERDPDQRTTHPTSECTLPAIPTPLTSQHNSFGRRRTNQLPPLKLENAATFPAQSTEPSLASKLPQRQSNHWGPSIIHSHPPRRPQALEPLIPLSAGLQITTNHTAMGTSWRGGGVLHCSSPSLGAREGTGHMSQGGLLEAQMALSQQAQRRRKTHQRQARDQRTSKATTYTDDGRPSKGVQRLHVLNRPTQRNIFWDEMTGETLDLREILQPSPVLPNQEERQHPQPGTQLLHGDEEHINTDTACGRSRRLTGAEETDGGFTMKKSLPWMVNWGTVKQGNLIPNHLSSWVESERAGRWQERPRPRRGRQREAVRGRCHVERVVWEPDLE